MPHAEKMKDVEQIHGFPAVKNLYKKYNAIMPSEADIERLFSFGGMLSLRFFTFMCQTQLHCCMQIQFGIFNILNQCVHLEIKHIN